MMHTQMKKYWIGKPLINVKSAQDGGVQCTSETPITTKESF